jgi:tetratricopeptide (TPR) repeat protein
VFVTPPYIPYAPALDACGLDLRYVVQIESAPTEGSWSAEQCLRSGRADEAAGLYRELMTGLHATDPDLMLGLARACFEQQDFVQAQATLERLRAANPNYRSAEGHLLYARCLEMQGNRDDALYELLPAIYRIRDAEQETAESRCALHVLVPPVHSPSSVNAVRWQMSARSDSLKRAIRSIAFAGCSSPMSNGASDPSTMRADPTRSIRKRSACGSCVMVSK